MKPICKYYEQNLEEIFEVDVIWIQKSQKWQQWKGEVARLYCPTRCLMPPCVTFYTHHLSHATSRILMGMPSNYTLSLSTGQSLSAMTELCPQPCIIWPLSAMSKPYTPISRYTTTLHNFQLQFQLSCSHFHFSTTSFSRHLDQRQVYTNFSQANFGHYKT